MHYIYGYFVKQLCRSHHLVPQSLLIRQQFRFHHLVQQSLLIRLMTLFLRMSLSGNLCFMISHHLFPVKSMIPFTIINSAILSDYPSHAQMSNLDSYMVHQVSTTASLFSFKRASFPSIFYFIWETGIQSPSSPAKMISFPNQSLRYSQLCIVSQKFYVLGTKGK